MSVKQLSVFLENRPGALYGMTGILSQNKIDMRALSVAETRDFGILRIIVDDPYKTATVLKDAGYVWGWRSLACRADRTRYSRCSPMPGSTWSTCMHSWGARPKPPI